MCCCGHDTRPGSQMNYLGRGTQTMTRRRTPCRSSHCARGRSTITPWSDPCSNGGGCGPSTAAPSRLPRHETGQSGRAQRPAQACGALLSCLRQRAAQATGQIAKLRLGGSPAAGRTGRAHVHGHGGDQSPRAPGAMAEVRMAWATSLQRRPAEQGATVPYMCNVMASMVALDGQKRCAERYVRTLTTSVPRSCACGAGHLWCCLRRCP
jgi:hypothetical protein